MSEVDKEEWCIVRYNGTDLLIRKVYQWEPTGERILTPWEYVARGFKSNEEALLFVNLFKE